MPYHKEGAYDGFDSVSEAFAYYRRCRTRKGFILSKKGVEKDKPICAHCKKAISEYRDNRCDYSPKKGNRKAFILVRHYICAWESLFEDIWKLADMGIFG